MAGLPSAYRCTECSAEISVIQYASGGICESTACRTTKAVAGRARREEEDERAWQKIATTHVIQQIGKELPVARIPYQPKPVVEQPAERIRTFQNKLKDSFRDACKRISETEVTDTPVQQPTEISKQKSQPVQTLLFKACATCRGSCCNLGHELAFLTPHHIEARLRSSPGLKPSVLYRQYLKQIPTYAFENSCIFQSESGCALTRELRSDICNDYHCKPLQNFESMLQEPSSKPIALVAMTKHKVQVVELISVEDH